MMTNQMISPSWQTFANYAQPIGTAIAGGMQAYGQNSQNNTALDLAQRASQFGPFGASGYGGMTGGYSGGQTNLNYGQFNPAYSQFAGLTGSALSNAGTAGSGGLPSNVSGANFMTPSLMSAYGLAGNQLNGPAMGTANTAFLGAGDQARQAAQGFPGYADSVYQNLTKQAAPWETKQYNDLMDSQFGSGRLGSSGGALQTQAFAQGLGTANLQRQLQATQTADQLQNSSASRAGALGGLGNSLLSNAFGNFSNMGNLGINNLGAQSSLSFLPANLQAAWMGNAGAGVQGANNIQQGGLNLFNAGLGAQTQNSGALARGGELASGNMLGNARFNNASPYGNLLSGIFGGGAGGGAAGSNPYTSLLGKAFNMFGGGDAAATAAAAAGNYGGYSATLGDLSGLNAGSFDYGALNASNMDALGGSFGSAGGQAAGAGDLSTGLSDMGGSLGASGGGSGAGLGAAGAGAAGAGADLSGMFAATQAANVADLGAATMLPSTEAALAGIDTAGTGAAAAGGGGSGASSAALAAAWPVAAAAAGFIGTKMLFDHNSKYSPSAYMGDVSNTIAGLKAQANDPKNAATRNLLLQRAQQYQTMLDKLKSGQQSFSSQLPAASGGAGAMLGRYTKKV